MLCITAIVSRMVKSSHALSIWSGAASAATTTTGRGCAPLSFIPVPPYDYHRQGHSWRNDGANAGIRVPLMSSRYSGDTKSEDDGGEGGDVVGDGGGGKSFHEGGSEKSRLMELYEEMFASDDGGAAGLSSSSVSMGGGDVTDEGNMCGYDSDDDAAALNSGDVETNDGFDSKPNGQPRDTGDTTTMSRSSPPFQSVGQNTDRIGMATRQQSPSRTVASIKSGLIRPPPPMGKRVGGGIPPRRRRIPPPILEYDNSQDAITRVRNTPASRRTTTTTNNNNNSSRSFRNDNNNDDDDDDDEAGYFQEPDLSLNDREADTPSMSSSFSPHFDFESANHDDQQRITPPMPRRQPPPPPTTSTPQSKPSSSPFPPRTLQARRQQRKAPPPPSPRPLSSSFPPRPLTRPALQVRQQQQRAGSTAVGKGRRGDGTVLSSPLHSPSSEPSSFVESEESLSTSAFPSSSSSSSSSSSPSSSSPNDPPQSPTTTTTTITTDPTKPHIGNEFWKHPPETLQLHLAHLQSQLYTLNSNTTFNTNSPRQVSKALFGIDTQRTDRDTLEGIVEQGKQALSGDDGGGKSRRTLGKMAELILKCRKLARHLKKLERDERNKATGHYATHIISSNDDDDDDDDQSRVVSTFTSSSTAKTDGKSQTTATATTTTEANEMKLPKKEEIMTSNPRKDPLVLIDTSAYIFRAYYSMPPLHRADGEPVGAVLGVCNMLNRLLLDTLIHNTNNNNNGQPPPPPRVVLVFDSKRSTTLRRALYPPYKANRKPTPIDLIPQFDLVRKAADAYGILAVEADGYEADDIIATLAQKACEEEGMDVNILSGDKDLMQLITTTTTDGATPSPTPTPSVQMIDPMTMERIDYDAVVEKWGVGPEKLGDVLALAGDAVDNVPGVPGIGKKIAAQLVSEFGSLEEILERAEGEVKQKKRRENLIQFKETARLSRQLVELDRNVTFQQMSMPDTIQRLSDITMENLDRNRLLQFYSDMGLQDLRRRVEGRFAAADAANSAVNGNTASMPASEGATTTSNAAEAVKVSDSNSERDGIAQRYAAILEDDNINDNNTIQPNDTEGPTAEETKDSPPNTVTVEPPKLRQGMPSFYSPRTYKKPPKPEDFDDVPF